MKKNMTFHKRKIWVVLLCCILMMTGLIGRLVYLMCFRSDYYYKKAKELHEREREIKAARGEILDAKGKVLASNRTVCTISVIHSQIKEPEKVIALLSEKLKIDEAEVRKRVEKISSIEIVKTNVEKSTGDEIRECSLAGVKVDEDYKRYYPCGSLASKVIGFTGGDNQGIIGLEVKYEEVLRGQPGKILTTTDARGVEIDKLGETREKPIEGKSLMISLDVNIQEFAQQSALKVMEEKQAERVSILLMNPQNGEIYACVNVPEFDLNDPFTLTDDLNMQLNESGITIPSEDHNEQSELAVQTASGKTNTERKQELLNQMWRNPCLNDTYEPGSTFKIITMAAGLEAGVVSPGDRFYCPGYKVVEDRRIHCAKRTGHGSQNFVEGAQNSCNPVFIEVGLRLGVERYYKYFRQFGLLDKTGTDLPGEAGTIMHQKKNMGEVELATVSFGQSFQITPVQLAATVSSLINGGRRVTPHFGVAVLNPDRTEGEKLIFPVKEGIVSEETSKEIREILETVVSQGSGKNAKIEGYAIGGKTATSQTLPRSANRYISSFLGFAPAEDPQILGLCIIHDPKGIYYGGTVAAPVIRGIFENILPYLGIEKSDVSDFSACEAFFKDVIETYGRLDILVNNAGITRDGLLMKMTESDYDAVLQTNLKGTFNGIRFASRQMLRQKSGRIINISSVSGILGNAGQANYSASKAGVIGLTKSAARELASRGITVNAVAPGFIKTEMTEVLSEQVQNHAKSQIPLGSFGNPEDVAEAVWFLASDKAGYITGQVLNVDGGMAM